MGELAKRSSDGSRSRGNAQLAGTRPRPSSVRCEGNLPRYLLCFWLWNSLKIILRKGLYHIINIQPDTPHALEVISDDGSCGWVPLEPSALKVPIREPRHRISPLVWKEHLVLSMSNHTLTNSSNGNIIGRNFQVSTIN